VTQKSTDLVVCSCQMASMWVLQRIDVLSRFFHCFEYFASSGCDKSGSSVSVFSIVVSSCDEPMPKAVVEFF
jgi:hypothetical protein